MGCWNLIVTSIRISCLGSKTFRGQSAKVSQSFKDELRKYANSSLTVLIEHYRVMLQIFPAFLSLSDCCLQ